MKRLIFIISFIILISLVIATPVLAYNFGDIMGLASQTAGETGLQQTSLSAIVASVITTVLGFVGAVFVILMIYGGFSWMVSSGNDEKVGKAKKTIAYAVIGLVVMIGAYSITFFISSAIEQSGISGGDQQEAGASFDVTCAAIGGSCKTNFACTDSGGTVAGVIDCGGTENENQAIAICCVPPTTPKADCESCGQGTLNVCSSNECSALGNCIFIDNYCINYGACNDCGKGSINICDKKECEELGCNWYGSSPPPGKNKCDL
jgi:type IV secretion system pilin